MAVSGTNGTSGTSNSAVTGTKSGIANNFDQFLTLLTTQLKNQSPLDPLDTNQFTQQLVQFAGVEQQLKTNETLGSLLSLNAAGTATNAVGFIGAKITADAAIALSQHGKVAPVTVYQRTDFAQSMIDGRTAQELDPGSKSAKEVQELLVYVRKQLRI